MNTFSVPVSESARKYNKGDKNEGEIPVGIAEI